MQRMKLKLLRTSLGYTQEEMANKCGIKRNTYSKIEQGIGKGNEQFWFNVMKIGNLNPNQLFEIQYEIQLSKQE